MVPGGVLPLLLALFSDACLQGSSLAVTSQGGDFVMRMVATILRILLIGHVVKAAVHNHAVGPILPGRL